MKKIMKIAACAVAGSMLFGMFGGLSSDADFVYSLGDADGDGIIGVNDATFILNIYALNAAGINAPLTQSEKEAADIDADSKITLSDAAFILTYYSMMAAGLDPVWEDLIEGEKGVFAEYTALDLAGVTKAEFKNRAVDTYSPGSGCDACYGSSYTLSSDLFPGYILAFGSEDTSRPKHIHIKSGKVTDSTYIGMSYAELENTLGKPAQWEYHGMNGDLVAVYYISGVEVWYSFFGYGSDLMNQIGSGDPIPGSDVEVYDKSITFSSAQVRNSNQFKKSDGTYAEYFLQKAYNYDIDQDGKSETIARYEEEIYNTSYGYTMYGVFDDDGSYKMYEGLLQGASGKSVIALVYDENIDRYYMAELYWHGSNSGCGIEIHDIDNWDREYAVYHLYTNWDNGVMSITDEVYTIAGAASSESAVKKYMQNVKIIDIADENSSEYICDCILEVMSLTEEANKDIEGYTALELMGVRKNEFISSTGDACNSDEGCYECNNSTDTLKSAMFPGYILAFGSENSSLPKHIHINSGKITDKVYVGMNYAELENALGTPVEWTWSGMDGSESAIYNVSGYKVIFKFFGLNIFQVGFSIPGSSVEIKDKSVKFVDVTIYK
ncbi:MAG: hypothetical protein ACI4JD_08125 [Ruminococcus sp.]